MSATNRGTEREKCDFYATPEWCVRALVHDPSFYLPKSPRSPANLQFLEPCAGNGAIISAINKAYDCFFPGHSGSHEFLPNWEAVEIQERFLPDLLHISNQVSICDFLEWEPGLRSASFFDLVISNPPYNRAYEIIQKAREYSNRVIMLLRLNFLASAKRADFMKKTKPNVYVLPNRPSFKGKGTDATEYAWFEWLNGVPETDKGRLHVLKSIPKKDR